MRRREFILLLGGAAAWPQTARAQQPDRVRRIGVLMSMDESDPEGQAHLAGFMQALRNWAGSAAATWKWRFAGELATLIGSARSQRSSALLADVCYWPKRI